MEDTTIKDLYGDDDTEAMYRAALNVPLADKIEMALLTIKTYEKMALDLSPEGFYVCFSGGKDSIVMAKLFEMAGVKHQLWYNNVTIDPPELVQYIKQHWPHARWNHPMQGNLPMHMPHKSCGPPTRRARWCCEIYKEQGGNGLFKAIGVRADESIRRKGLWKTVNNNNNTGLILCPIVYWTEKDVWSFISQNNMEYCSLYDETDSRGTKLYTRLGCVGCPMSGAKGQARDFKRWPKYEAMWRRGFQAYWDKYKGTPTKRGEDRWIEKFPTVDDLWDWWVSGKAYEGESADCQFFLW